MVSFLLFLSVIKRENISRCALVEHRLIRFGARSTSIVVLKSCFSGKFYNLMHTMYYRGKPRKQENLPLSKG